MQKLLFACILRSSRSAIFGKFLQTHPWWNTILVKLLSRALYKARLNKGKAMCIIRTLFKKNYSWFPFTNKDRYLHKDFQENNLDTVAWIRSIKNMLELYGQGNIIQNIFKIVGVTIGRTRRENIGHKHEGPLILRIQILEKTWKVL